MAKFYKASFIILFFCVAAMPAFAQDTLNKRTDSVRSAMLDSYNRRLADIEKQRISDSIQKATLEAQLSEVKSNDAAKKNELQKQLDVLTANERERIRQKRAQIDQMRKKVKGYPVEGFFEDTLFTVYSRLGSFSPKDRAEAIRNRIIKLGDDFNYRSDSLLAKPAETTTDIVYGETIITSITENDAIWRNMAKDSLADLYRNKIDGEIKRYKSETSLFTLGKEICMALLVIGLISLLIFYIQKFFRWIGNKIRLQQGRKLQGFKIKEYTLFDSERQVRVLLSINTIIKWLVILLAIYLTLPVLFGIFPWTKDFAESLFGYILNPLHHIARAFWNFLPNLITIIVIVVVFRYFLKFIHFLKVEIAKGNLNIPGFYADWANPTYQIIRVLIYAFMIVVIFPYLPNSDSKIFQGVSVFLGFLFTFGSAGSLSNVIAGLTLTYMRSFIIGDRVKIGEVTGDVLEKSLLVTRIRTIKNEIISIPNSTVMNSHTINYSSESGKKGLIMHTTVTIGYDVPWRVMHEVLIEAAIKTENLLADPAPFVLQTSLDDFYVSYQINAYTREPARQAAIYSQLHANIQDFCNEKGIEIMSPHYRAARDGSQTTIPADYLPQGYEAPPFSIRVQPEQKGK